MEMVRSGSSGEAVETLQKKLAAKGFNPGAADGIFGPKTDDALRRFQEAEGLTVDGIAGPNTYAALGLVEAEAESDGLAGLAAEIEEKQRGGSGGDGERTV